MSEQDISSIIIEDESSNLSVEKKYPEIENLTMFGAELDSHRQWMYYKYRAANVIGIKFNANQNAVTIVRLACSDDKTCQDAMITFRGDIPFLDTNYPEWRNGNLLIMNYVKRKKVTSSDFGSLQPDTYTMNDTILLCKLDSKTGKANADKLYCIFAGRESHHHSLYSLLVLSKLYFSEYMARPSMVSGSSTLYSPNKIGRAMVYSLILGFFQSRRGYIVPDIMDIDYDVVSPLHSLFDEPMRDHSFNTKKIEEIGFGIRKKVLDSGAPVDKNPDEEFTLNEVIGLGIDSIINDWQDGAKPFTVRMDISDLQNLVKSVKLQKGAVIIEVKKDKLTEEEIKNLEETLDTDNIIINFPNDTVAQTGFALADLRGAMNMLQ